MIAKDRIQILWLILLITCVWACHVTIYMIVSFYKERNDVFGWIWDGYM
jgi:hypothetical protein